MAIFIGQLKSLYIFIEKLSVNAITFTARVGQ
jgi:hypothetical protein